MIPARFDYVSAGDVQEAIALLAAREGSLLIAGGQSLIPAMTVRRVAPALLVDIGAIDDLRGIGRHDGGLRIGATATLDEIASSTRVRRAAEVLAECAAAAGDPQVRHRGTLGGTLADGHPAGDLIAAAIVLDGVATIAGADGSRRIAAADLVTAAYKTALGAAEVLTALDVPSTTERSGSAYAKQRHPGSGYAICGVAASIALSEHGRVASARVALTGAADRPMRLAAVEAAIAGKTVAQGQRHVAEAVAGSGIAWRSDLAASGEYRAHLAGVLATRAISLASERAMGG